MNEPPGGGFRMPFGGLGANRPMSAIKILVLLNAGVFLVQVLSRDAQPNTFGPIKSALAVSGLDWWQPWRYVTFQFVHGGLGHIFWNMFGLFFLGRLVEQVWGRKRFLWFYLTSGALAGVVYAVLAHVPGLNAGVGLVGASGGVYAVFLACLVLFPKVKVYLFMMIPMPMWVAGLLWFGGAAQAIIAAVAHQSYDGRAFWSAVAHMGGALGGAIWIWVLPRVAVQAASARMKVSQGAWQRKMQRETEDDRTIDEILKKIHEQGINSLSAKEKKTLAKATDKQREQR